MLRPGIAAKSLRRRGFPALFQRTGPQPVSGYDHRLHERGRVRVLLQSLPG
jgi:hypothetical protein